MSKFQCLTCMETLDAESMMKHLSSTRHKTIQDAYSEEEVSCEECQDTNVHQLQIIRFGGEDMSLLCNLCFKKEYNESEKPSTSYSLSNGSFLKFWGMYTKVRSCACENCGSESKLNVNDKKKVLCDNCLKPLKTSDSDKYLSERSGKFLYVYLGIKEPSTTKTFQRKGGRKVGRRGKGKEGLKQKNEREKKALTVHQQIAKTAYSIKQQNNTIESDSNMSLRSFKGVNADGASKASNGFIRKGKKESNTNPKNNRKNGAKQHSKGANTESFHKTSYTDSRIPNVQPKKSSPGDKSTSKKAIRSKNETSNKTPPSSDETRSSRNSVKTLEPSMLKQDAHQKKIHHQNPTGIQNNSSLKENSKMKGRAKKDGAKHIADVKSRNIIKKGRESTNTDSKKQEKQNNNGKEANRKEKLTQSVDLKAEDIEEGEILKAYTEYTPILTYPDLDSYFNELSYALYMEEKLEKNYSFIQDFQIIWHSSGEANFFVVNINTANNPEFDELISPELLKLGRLPFTKRQPLLLVSKDEKTVWYAYVKEAELKRNSLKILLELYPWNKKKLPRNCPSDDFRLLPCSAQSNRILFAMTRIKNPKFIDLILGQKPVKQIFFKNRLQFTSDNFNESQKSAIQHVLNNSVTVLQGPPGTGKTSTIEEIILQLIGNFHSFPILCVAASNIAIDNIAEKFVKNWPKIKILRIVSDGKESQYNTEHPLGKVCLHNIVNDQLPPDMKENLIKLRSGRSRDVSKNQYNKLLTCQNDISDRNVLQAQILFTTNIAAGGRQLKALKELPVVIMDESTQSSEASTLVPLSLPGIRTFVFVGDQKQLSSFSNIPQLKMSLFERVLLNGCYTKPHMLDTQYRMHPTISQFPITEFYGGELKDGVTAEQKSWPGINYPLFFYQCDKGPESKVFNSNKGMRGFTYNNHHECQEIVKILYKLVLDKGVGNDQIGIITPYSAQRDLLSEILVEDRVINPKKMAMEQEVDEADALNAGLNRSNSPKKNTINIINGIFVSTIDSFQGHEKNFIIFSCVRNNPENKIGFVSDKRRMNVALTRAKNGLIIVGNKNTLSKDQLWGRYIEYLDDKEIIFESLDMY